MAASGHVPFALFDLRLELLAQFELIFENVLQPVANLLLLARGELADLGLYLLHFAHGVTIHDFARSFKPAPANSAPPNPSAKRPMKSHRVMPKPSRLQFVSRFKASLHSGE